MSSFTLAKTVKFHKTPCNFYESNNEVWLTRRQIGEALGYDDPKVSIRLIHTRHKERLDKFSKTIQIESDIRRVQSEPTLTASGDSTEISQSSTYRLGGKQNTTIYNERGIMEICRWSRQPRANEFMDWVWDIVQSYREGKLISTKQDNVRTPTPVAEKFFIEQNKVLSEIKEQNKQFQEMMTKSFDSMCRLTQCIIDTSNIGGKIKRSNDIKNSQYKLWKKEVYRKTTEIVKVLDNGSTSNHVLSFIYKQLRSDYGIVWEQNEKEYRAKNHVRGNVSTIELVYSDPVIKDIFDSRLEGMLRKIPKLEREVERRNNIVNQIVDKNNIDPTESDDFYNWEQVHREVLRYAKKIRNRSSHGMSVYASLYRMMCVDWSKYEGDFLDGLSKKQVIKKHKELADEFVRVLKDVVGYK
ncbi:MAG: BRO family protein [Anaerostipes sp.]|uniref:BRO family protein n=1 Tax=Anaerostipes sp. TaxID=1872530 RepID=UPI00399665D3